MKGDKLVIDLAGSMLALDTSAVDGIVEVERVPFLPGQTGFVNGIISLRNEPVAVVDLHRVFNKADARRAGVTHKIVVVRDKGRLLGLDIGTSAVSFLWEEEIKDSSYRQEGGPYTTGVIETEEQQVRVLDWNALFDAAAKILSSGDKGA